MADGDSTAAGLWTVDAPVLLVPPRPPIACQMILSSLPPSGGSGVVVSGLDPRVVPGAHVYDNGTIQTPTLRLTGRYDGTGLTLTQAAQPVPAGTESAVRPADEIVTACPDPGDGRYSSAQRNAAIGYAQAQPDLGAVWLSDHQRVLNVSFIGDLDRHRRALRTVYPGPLCVVRALLSAQALTALQHRLHDDPELTARGIHVLSSGHSCGMLRVMVVAAGPPEIGRIQERYGPAVVVNSWLRPVHAD